MAKKSDFEQVSEEIIFSIEKDRVSQKKDRKINEQNAIFNIVCNNLGINVTKNDIGKCDVYMCEKDPVHIFGLIIPRYCYRIKWDDEHIEDYLFRFILDRRVTELESNPDVEIKNWEEPVCEPF